MVSKTSHCSRRPGTPRRVALAGAGLALASSASIAQTIPPTVERQNDTITIVQPGGQHARHDTIRVVVHQNDSSRQAWSPDVGEWMDWETAGLSPRSEAPATIALSPIGDEEQSRSHWINEGRLGTDSLTHSLGSSQGWLEDQQLTQFDSWKGATPEGAMREADEAAQKWLPRINDAFMRVVSPVVDRVRSWLDRE